MPIPHGGLRPNGACPTDIHVDGNIHDPYRLRSGELEEFKQLPVKALRSTGQPGMHFDRGALFFEQGGSRRTAGPGQRRGREWRIEHNPSIGVTRSNTPYVEIRSRGCSNLPRYPDGCQERDRSSSSFPPFRTEARIPSIVAVTGGGLAMSSPTCMPFSANVPRRSLQGLVESSPRP